MAEERVVRRLAAILAADVAGYSGLMGADEKGTFATLKTYRRQLIDPKIAEYRERIVKTTGDGALVEFASVVASAWRGAIVRPLSRSSRRRSPSFPHRRSRMGLGSRARDRMGRARLAPQPVRPLARLRFHLVCACAFPPRPLRGRGRRAPAQGCRNSAAVCLARSPERP